MRKNGKLAKIEVYSLDWFDEVVVHSKTMEKVLRDAGVARPCLKILNFFDYISDIKPNARPLAYDICFAGNLRKSIFVSKITELKSTKLQFHLYGINPPCLSASSNVFYEGVFSPDDIGGIKGTWGLVWDGNSITTCNGLLGTYLKYNSSHKLSLYLAIGIPLIVWKQSAIADLVEQEKIGITVESLTEIESAIDNITPCEYDEITRNVDVYSNRIRNGCMLGSLL